jgi:hypothetical protein
VHATVAGLYGRPDGPVSIDGAVVADTVRRMRRSCARPECSSRANATLSYDYADSSVILGPLADEPHPMSHDLCGVHADSMSVPRGWRLEDWRNVTDLPMSSSETEPRSEPGSEPDSASGSSSESVAS